MLPGCRGKGTALPQVLVFVLLLLQFSSVPSLPTSQSSQSLQVGKCGSPISHGSGTTLAMLPTDINFQPNQIEVLRIIGKLDVQVDQAVMQDAQRELDRTAPGKKRNIVVNNGRATSVRVFECRIPGGTRCILKEYLPVGSAFGRRELLTTRKLTLRWNKKLQELTAKGDEEEEEKEEGGEEGGGGGGEEIAVDDEYMESIGVGAEGAPLQRLIASMNSMNDMIEIRDSQTQVKIVLPMLVDEHDIPPFPLLLGSLRPDSSIESIVYREEWAKRFPRSPPPEAGNLWLVFKWDEASFRTFQRFPPLPQVVEGLDYFRKDARDDKRWRFVRKMMRKGLESVDYLHRTGYVHNSLSSESLWLTSTNQQEIQKVAVKITDLGLAQRFADLGPFAREAAAEDLYQLGLIFLQLVVSSFNDDNVGAQIARKQLSEWRRAEHIGIAWMHYTYTVPTVPTVPTVTVPTAQSSYAKTPSFLKPSP
ncbi:hypothetical protein B484DRAFT_458435 [Ochromonadaceae sp. CCMP2298]|nr:hypothetical protein B484DRAFT_458435 [Ochromonadaceae sp. CCMP2298]